MPGAGRRVLINWRSAGRDARSAPAAAEAQIDRAVLSRSARSRLAAAKACRSTRRRRSRRAFWPRRGPDRAERRRRSGRGAFSFCRASES
ncbi:hypothetical protein HBB16_12105 [Pseudonocardia sp. MCCB 268]|nr:hypothetical protein [Pseudonocardia cytotoxica]